MNFYLPIFVICYFPILLFSQTQRATELRSNVVAISAFGQTGFGFITGERNGQLFVATAAHVIEDALEADQEVTVRFFEDYNKYQGKILRNYQDVDVALIEVKKPAGLSWNRNCLGIATTNSDVAFIGREQNWYVPTERSLGTIYSLQNNRIEADISSVLVGTSGAPLIAESGIVGLIVQSDGVKALAIDLNQLRAVLSEYNYFFELTGAGLLIPTNTNDQDTEALYKDIQAYKSAKTKDDIPAYQSYIRDIPNGEFKDKAIARIQELEQAKEQERENARWEIAKLRDDVPGYQKYLSLYPNGRYKSLAQQKIKELEKKTNNLDIVRDKDGHEYTTKIMKDGKRWMTQNLNVEVDSSWCYNNDPRNCEQYGRLYNLKWAKKACQGLGPGWKLPMDKDWEKMTNHFGGTKNSTDAFNKLMKGGSSGFAGMLGGRRHVSGTFSYIGDVGFYWTNTGDDDSTKNYEFQKSLYINRHNKTYALSVRCLKDN